MVAGEAADEAKTGEQTFRGHSGGYAESATGRSKTERMDIGGDVEACRRESLRTQGLTERAGAKKTTRESGKSEYGGGSNTESGRGGGRGEALLGADPPLIQEAWHRIQGWYKAAVDHALPPAQVTLERITA